jgi:hypothetical protein
MYSAVCNVTPRKDFSLKIVFDTGEVKIPDMKPYPDFGVFRRISTYENFANVRAAFDTVEWGEGADLDPEFVCQKSEAAPSA